MGLFAIKRLKTNPTDGGNPAGQKPAIHFAQKLDAKGNVVLWTTDREQALEVEQATAEKIAAVYARRPNAGKIAAVPLDVVAPVPAAPAAPATPPVSLPSGTEKPVVEKPKAPVASKS